MPGEILQPLPCLATHSATHVLIRRLRICRAVFENPPIVVKLDARRGIALRSFIYMGHGDRVLMPRQCPRLKKSFTRRHFLALWIALLNLLVIVVNCAASRRVQPQGHGPGHEIYLCRLNRHGKSNGAGASIAGERNVEVAFTSRPSE